MQESEGFSGHPRVDADHKLGMLDPPQALGMQPTRQFWADPDNQQLVQSSHVVVVGVTLFLIGILDLSWWGAALVALAMLYVLAGLLEHSLRAAAKRRVAPRSM